MIAKLTSSNSLASGTGIPGILKEFEAILLRDMIVVSIVDQPTIVTETDWNCRFESVFYQDSSDSREQTSAGASKSI
jgi:hypothetical protein